MTSRTTALLLLLILATPLPGNAAERLVPVLSPPAAPATPWSRARLIAAYSGRLKYAEAGCPITRLMIADSALHARFVREALGIHPHQLERIGLPLGYTGEATPAHEVADWKAMREALRSTPCALGYLPEGEVPVDFRLVAGRPGS